MSIYDIGPLFNGRGNPQKNWFSTSLVFIGLVFLGIGCTSQPAEVETATPQPTQEIIRIAITTEAAQAKAAIDVCRDIPGTALVLEETTASPDIHGYDLVVSLGVLANSPPHAAAIAGDRLIVVVPGNEEPPPEISSATLNSILSGQAKFWSELPNGGRLGSGQIEFWNYPEGHPFRELFATVLAGSRDRIQVSGMLAPYPEAMAEAITQGNGRIGYIPASWIISGITEVPLDPELAINLTLPLLVYSSDEFAEKTHILIDCLQHGPGQEVLMDYYGPVVK